jgi:hypothetical protein
VKIASSWVRWSFLPLAALAGAGCETEPHFGDVNINSRVQAADGLDLRAVGQLLQKSDSAEDFERRLNEQGGVNNLDLNDDGKVDFIHVTEYGSEQAKGFSLTVQPEAGQTQEVATIEIEKPQEASKQTDVVVRGSDAIYGPSHSYHYAYPLDSMLLMAYLFRPHPLYISPFGFGMYPAYYGAGYIPVSPARYVTRTQVLNQGAPAAQAATGRASSLVSPNKGKNAESGVRASLRNPTQSQRAFQTRRGGAVSSRGFADRASSGTSRSPSVSRPSAPRMRSFRSGGFRGRR